MYNKTYNGGKKRSKKRKAKTTDGRQNQRIAKLENILLPSIEYKSKDINSSNVAVGSGGYANYPMFQLAQGSGHSERVGDKVTLKNMNCSLALTRADTNNIVRIIFAATPSTTALTLVDVLEYADHSVYGNLVFSSPYKRRATSSEKTYTILFDKCYNLTEEISTMVDKFKLKLPKNGKVVEFNSIGQHMPDNWNVSILAISDSTAVGHPVMNCNVRSKYFDL